MLSYTGDLNNASITDVGVTPCAIPKFLHYPNYPSLSYSSFA
jgi:hypothetical protein